MRIDPEATLRIWRVDVEVDGRTYTIPPLPASAWLVAACGPLPDIVPGMLPDADDLKDAIIDGAVSHEECARAARAALEAASGTRWWSAAKLAQAVVGSWVSVELLSRGVDLDRISFGAYLAAAWHTYTKHAKDVEVTRLEAELDAPPRGLDPAEWFDDTDAVATFAAAMATTAGR